MLLTARVLAEGYTDVTVDEAYDMLSGNPAIFLLDVRAASEYEYDGHIPGAYLIPHTSVKARANELPTDKGGPVLVYCRSGGRSRLASQDLVDLGYTDVMNMLGGFSTWAGKGYPSITGPQQGTFPVAETSMALVLPVLLIAWASIRSRATGGPAGPG